MELYFDDGAKINYISSGKPVFLTGRIAKKDDCLSRDQFKEASNLASKGLNPHWHYKLLLEAYSAWCNKDYRKAIIEASTALEKCLTFKILNEFSSQGITFGEKLLQKFRMLGGRFELVRLLDINLPNKDYDRLIVNPRNDVIHKASFPSKDLASQVIKEVEELLYLFSPQLYPNE